MSSPTFLPTSQKGGDGGTAFSDLATYLQISDYRLVKINYWTNSSIIRGIQFEWESPRGEIFTGDVHGASSDTSNYFTLNENERIVVMTGRAGNRVDALTLITNQGEPIGKKVVNFKILLTSFSIRRSVNFGGNGGTPFQWVISFTEYPNIALHHLSGRSGLDLDACEAIFVVENFP